MKSLDFVIFGATGYTGEYVTRELIKECMKVKYSIGIAGRSHEKLEHLLNKIEKPKEVKVEIIVANIDNENEIDEMTNKCIILLNCVGPYQLYGETVVKSCLKNKTHHLDISGEPTYLEKMQVLYDEEAKKQNVLIIGACGADSVPAEAGFEYTERECIHQLSFIESYLIIKDMYPIHSTTLESAIYSFKNRQDLKQYRKVIFNGVKQPARPQTSTLKYHDYSKTWSIPFLGSDLSVVRRTQQALLSQKENFIHYVPYLCIGSKLKAISGLIFGAWFAFLVSNPLTRYFAIKFPRLATFGIFSSKGATKEEIERAKFEMTFHGFAKSENGNSCKIITAIKGPEFGYVTCAKCIVACAMTIREENSRLNKRCGVSTTGDVFYGTSWINRLQRMGIEFNIGK